MSISITLPQDLGCHARPLPPKEIDRLRRQGLQQECTELIRKLTCNLRKVSDLLQEAEEEKKEMEATKGRGAKINEELIEKHAFYEDLNNRVTVQYNVGRVQFTAIDTALNPGKHKLAKLSFDCGAGEQKWQKLKELITVLSNPVQHMHNTLVHLRNAPHSWKSWKQKWREADKWSAESQAKLRRCKIGKWILWVLGVACLGAAAAAAFCIYMGVGIIAAPLLVAKITGGCGLAFVGGGYWLRVLESKEQLKADNDFWSQIDKLSKDLSDDKKIEDLLSLLDNHKTDVGNELPLPDIKPGQTCSICTGLVTDPHDMPFRNEDEEKKESENTVIPSLVTPLLNGRRVCMHVYHEKCLDDWISSQESKGLNPDCPYDRMPCNGFRKLDDMTVKPKSDKLDNPYGPQAGPAADHDDEDGHHDNNNHLGVPMLRNPVAI